MFTVKKGSLRDLHHYHGMLKYDFRAAAIIPEALVLAGVRRGEQELLLVCDDATGIAVAYAFVCCRNLYDYPMITQFAVLPWYRGRGYGVECFRLVLARYKKSQGVLAQLTKFPGEEFAVARRQQFLLRLGFSAVPCSYRFRGEETLVYAKPMVNKALPGPVIHRIIPDIAARCAGSAAAKFLINIERSKKNEG